MSAFDIAIVGGGMAGSVAALSLARLGRRVALLAPPAAVEDKRTTALMDQSIRFMERLGLWDRIAPSAAALSTMRIIDGTNRLLRAPTVSFRSSEVGLEAFGYNIPNAALLAVLGEAVTHEGNITLLPQAAEHVDLLAEGVQIALQDGSRISAELVVAADGRKSKMRDNAGIGVRHWSYPQTAIVLNFSHDLPHGNISTEFHTESGPFTQVPLPGNRSSLVWVRKPTEADVLMALSPEELSLRVEKQMQSMLGKVIVEPDVQAWPLSGMMAHRFGKGRLVLAGEAGHVFPPIGVAARHHPPERPDFRSQGRAYPGIDRRSLRSPPPCRRHDPHRRGGPAESVTAFGFPADADGSRRWPARAFGAPAAACSFHARGHRARARAQCHRRCPTGEAAPLKG